MQYGEICMITTYSRGNFTLKVETRIGLDEVTFTILRTAPLTDDDAWRLNREIADYPAARGAQLVHVRETGAWVVRAGEELVSDNGDPTAELRWVGTSPDAMAGAR